MDDELDFDELSNAGWRLVVADCGLQIFILDFSHYKVVKNEE
jgi:hypothetical protein